jgi:hypothetical protein
MLSRATGARLHATSIHGIEFRGSSLMFLSPLAFTAGTSVTNLKQRHLNGETHCNICVLNCCGTSWQRNCAHGVYNSHAAGFTAGMLCAT